MRQKSCTHTNTHMRRDPVHCTYEGGVKNRYSDYLDCTSKWVRMGCKTKTKTLTTPTENDPTLERQNTRTYIDLLLSFRVHNRAVDIKAKCYGQHGPPTQETGSGRRQHSFTVKPSPCFTGDWAPASYAGHAVGRLSQNRIQIKG